MIFEIWELIPEQEILLNNKNIDQILDKNDINISRHSLKNWPSGGQYSGSWEGKQVVFRSAGGKERIERWVGEVHQSHSWRSQKPFGYRQENEHSNHCWGQYCSKTVCDIVNFSINWWATLHLKDIFISSSWFIISNMAMTPDRCYQVSAFEWTSKDAHHQDWLWDHLFWISKAHFTAWIWVMNIIDDANAFPFMIWFDKLRGIHGEEHWAYNDEPLYDKLWDACLDDWIISMKTGDNITWRVLFQLEASLWLIDNHDGVGTMRTINAITILRIIQRMNDRLRSSWWIKQHHTRGQSQAW